MLSHTVTFESFARDHGPRIRAGLVAAYGPDPGLDAAAEAMAYGFEHWARLARMANPAGYLYRVGQTAARRARRTPPALPVPEPSTLPTIDPGLIPALDDLSQSQRTCVLLVHAFGWTRVEVAELLDVDESSVRTHIRRGMKKLHGALEESTDVSRAR